MNLRENNQDQNHLQGSFFAENEKKHGQIVQQKQHHFENFHMGKMQVTPIELTLPYPKHTTNQSLTHKKKIYSGK